MRSVLNGLAALIGLAIFVALLLYAVDMTTPPPPREAERATPTAASRFDTGEPTASAPEHHDAAPAAAFEVAVDERVASSEPAPRVDRDSARSGRATQDRDDAPVAQARAAEARKDPAKEGRRLQPARRESTSRQARQIPRQPPRRETAEETSQATEETSQVGDADDFSVRWHRAGE